MKEWAFEVESGRSKRLLSVLSVWLRKCNVLRCIGKGDFQILTYEFKPLRIM